MAGTSIGFVQKINSSKRYNSAAFVLKIVMGNKLLSDIPAPDVVIFMGCNVSCPDVPSQYAENWGLDDPSGQSDEVFLETIRQIEQKMLQLKARLS